MNGNKKKLRIGAAAVLAALSIIGLSEAGAAPGSASAKGTHVWCC